MHRMDAVRTKITKIWSFRCNMIEYSKCLIKSWKHGNDDQPAHLKQQIGCYLRHIITAQTCLSANPLVQIHSSGRPSSYMLPKMDITTFTAYSTQRCACVIKTRTSCLHPVPNRNPYHSTLLSPVIKFSRSCVCELSGKGISRPGSFYWCRRKLLRGSKLSRPGIASLLYFSRFLSNTQLHTC